MKKILPIVVLILFTLTIATHGQESVERLITGWKGAMLIKPTRIFISGNYAYVLSQSYDFGQNNTLEIIDISNPLNPVHKSSISHVTGGAQLNGAIGLYISGGYAYVTLNYALEVIDVSDPMSPFHKSTWYGGSPAFVHVSGTYAYLLSYTGNLTIVNVSNPLNLTLVGSVALNLTGPNGILVEGGFAFIPRLNGLEIADISIPTAPSHKGLWTGSVGTAFSVGVSGNYAYLSGADRQWILNVTNKAAPSYVNYFGYYGQFTVVSGNRLYSGAYNVLRIYDISIPTAPTLIGGNSTGNPPGASSIALSGNYVYHASSGFDGLKIFDATNSSLAATILHGAGGIQISDPADIFVTNGKAYITSITKNSLQIIDISNPAIPVKNGVIYHGTDGATLDYPTSVFVAGDYAYVTSFYGSALEIINVSNPNAPVHTGKILNGSNGAILTNPTSVFVVGTNAYVASQYGNALEIVDVSNPAIPVHKGTLLHGAGGAHLYYPKSVYVSGNYAYVGCYGNTLEIVNVSNPAIPVHQGKISMGSGVPSYDLISVSVSGIYAYVSCYGGSNGSLLG